MIVVEIMEGEEIHSIEFQEVPRVGDLVACGYPVEGKVKSVIWRPAEAPLIILEKVHG